MVKVKGGFNFRSWQPFKLSRPLFYLHGFLLYFKGCCIIKDVGCLTQLKKTKHHHNFLTSRWIFQYRSRLQLVTPYGLTRTRRLNFSINKIAKNQPLTCCSGSVSVNMKPPLHRCVSTHSMSPRHPTVSLGLPLSELFWSSEERKKKKKTSKKHLGIIIA